MKNKKIFIAAILCIIILFISNLCFAAETESTDQTLMVDGYDMSDIYNYVKTTYFFILKQGDDTYLFYTPKISSVSENTLYLDASDDFSDRFVVRYGNSDFSRLSSWYSFYFFDKDNQKWNFSWDGSLDGKSLYTETASVVYSNQTIYNADKSTVYVEATKERGTDTEPNPGTNSGEGSDTGTDENNNSWLSKIFNSIGNIGSSILEGLEVPFNTIKEGLDNIFKTISNIVSFLNPVSDNFFGKKLIELFTDLFKYLFVPSENPFTSLSDKFEEKFQIINQIKNLISSLLGNFDYGDSIPEFKITYLGASASIIDFSLFVEYRGWIHGIILAIAWYSFLIRLFKKLPGIIGGFNNDN